MPGGDFAFTIARLLVLSTWRLAQLEALSGAPDPVLAAVAAKSVKELAHHRHYAAEWTVRLGDGTAESRGRIEAALREIAPWLDELLADRVAERLGAAPATMADRTLLGLAEVLVRAGLSPAQAMPLGPASLSPVPGTGRDGAHTEHLAPLLTELQSVAREHPDATW